MLPNPEFRTACDFLIDYSSTMTGSTVHISRVIRCTERIAKALNISVDMSILHKSIIYKFKDDKTGEIISEVAQIKEKPINFYYNRSLSELSWNAFDNNLTLDEIQTIYNKTTNTPLINQWVLLILVALANAAFCAIFGGNIASILTVLVATLAGFRVRQLMLRKHINIYIVFMVASTISTAVCSLAIFDSPETVRFAYTASILYLVPGVPLITGIMDILESHVLSGLSRLVHAGLLILSAAAGFSTVLLIAKQVLI